jgi:hypothetical protein
MLGSVCGVKQFHLSGKISLMTKKLKRRCGTGTDNSQNTSKLRVSTINKAMGQLCQCWWRICREITVISRFEYHMF